MRVRMESPPRFQFTRTLLISAGACNPLCHSTRTCEPAHEASFGMTSAATDLHTAGHRRGVVAAPHHAAVEAGRAIIAEGGNALEAMAAAIAAVYPHMSQVGGDGFWLVREPVGRVRALMAPGRAGSNARRELYREHETVPARGPLAALTVPGAVSGWMLALEAARAQGGRMPLADLLAPAIRDRKSTRLNSSDLGISYAVLCLKRR